ncbi:hypothetical protein [Candidatus Deianiraea vastatrix]|uniref:Lipoprotein n=1 Tax=Candidatus Deianiraea vastatrix TaxID=2163644 RepID=A0A5B8XCI4_9RICK|nr:hypothetical protein [Candidatus Deianiraea vastatrix]QED23048.1 hypothetical protein Deia_00240 [Candidatus Deianiraea vastatrix]
MTLTKAKLLLTLTTLTILTSCATTHLPDHMIDKTPKYIGKDIQINEDETNLGMPISSQLMSLPMYGALMLLKTPMYLNPQTYKKETIDPSLNKGSYFFVNADNSNNIVYCTNKVMRLVVGFGGEEGKLTYTQDDKILPHYEIKKEDIYLLQGDGKTKITPSNIFIAGSSFNTVTSRNLKITYPIARTKLHHERFIDFPIDCSSISNTQTKLVIAKIYKDGKVFAENIEFAEFKSENQRGNIQMFEYRSGMGALVRNNGVRADIGFTSKNSVLLINLEQ